MGKSTLKIHIKTQEVFLDDVRVKLNKRWFDIYTLLAYHDYRYNRGLSESETLFVNIPKIRLLPHERRLTKASVGRTIHRHIHTREKYEIITSAPKHSTSLFGINKQLIAKVEFDSSIQEIQQFLKIDQAVVDDEYALIEEIATISIAEVLFRQLKYDSALGRIALIEDKELHIDTKINILILKSRIFDKILQWERSNDAIALAYDLYKQNKARIKSSTVAKIWIQKAQWELDYGQDKIAKQYFDNAKRSLEHADYIEWGYIHNGLAILDMRNNRWKLAEEKYKSSLRLWFERNWWYGVRAVFINLALLFFRQAEANKKGKFIDTTCLTKSKYWAERSYRYSQLTLVGSNTIFSEVLLAAINRKLGDLKQSKDWLEKADDVVSKVKLPHEIGYFYLEYGLYFEETMNATSAKAFYLKAAKAFRVSKKPNKELECKNLAAKIKV